MGLLSLAPRGSGYALALLAVPFAGVLVRYRVDYRPKDGRVQLGEEEEYGAPGKRWLKSGYVEMTRRVYRLEGWPGFQKGIMPSISLDLLLAVIAFLLDIYSNMQVKISMRVPYSIYQSVHLIWSLLICIPLTSVIHRAIVTPYCLPWCDVPLGLRVLLSPSERRHPATLYRTPGLLVVQALQLTVLLLRRVILPSIVPLNALALGLGIWGGLVTSLVMTAITVLVLVPLQVVSARLMVQRNGVDDDFGAAESGGVEGVVAEFCGTENVIQIPDERYPYLGLGDAVRRIIDEEGVWALYRGWWVTLLLI